MDFVKIEYLHVRIEDKVVTLTVNSITKECILFGPV